MVGYGKTVRDIRTSKGIHQKDYTIISFPNPSLSNLKKESTTSH